MRIRKCRNCHKKCKEHRTRFCSPRCFYDWSKGQQRPYRRYERERRKCPVCEKKFEVRCTKRQTYCSRPCYGVAQRKELSHEQGSDFCFGSAWQRRRTQILNRDGCCCVFCGAPARSVHHMVPRTHGGSHLPSNLATACWKCHNAMDKTVAIMKRLNPNVSIEKWLRTFIKLKE